VSWLLISATLYNKKNRYFYVRLLLSRTLEFFMLFVALASRLVLNTLLILWRNLNIVSTKLFPQSDLLRYINEYKIKILCYKNNLPLLNWCKLTKAVVLNFFPHGRFWQFVYKENVRCTRLMQRSLQVVIRQKFVLWMLYTCIVYFLFSLVSLLRKYFFINWNNVI
jgi:hypothetical protein